MRKKVLLIVSVWLLFVPAVFTYEDAVSFESPLRVSGTLTQNFGVFNNEWEGYHLGEDIVFTSEVPVYAVGNGEVKIAEYKNGYGYVVIIEHRLTDGSHVCSLYGHLRDADLTNLGSIQKGELVGYLSSDSNYNNGAIHLHFGIRIGGYSTTSLYYHTSTGWSWNWPYIGYTRNANLTNGDQKLDYDFTHQDMLNLWYDPSDFINSHSQPQVLPGQLSNGTFNPRIQACAEQFSCLGLTPHDNGGGLYVHSWNGITLQDFLGSDGNQYTIVDNPVMSQAFLLMGGIRWYYLSQINGPVILGPPSSNEYVFSYYPYLNGSFDTPASYITWKRQDFDSGDALMWTNQLVEGEFRDIYALLPPTGGGDPDFYISLVPGDTLEIYAQPLSDTSIYVTSSNIGQAVTEVYLNNSYIGNLGNFELTIGNLSPDTTYRIYLVAKDNQGNILDQTDPVSVTTLSTPTPDIPLVELVYWIRGSQIEVFTPTLVIKS